MPCMHISKKVWKYRRSIKRSGPSRGLMHKEQVFGHCVALKTSSHLAVNQGSERQVVKKICKILPHICIAVFSKALIVEAIAATPKRAISKVAVCQVRSNNEVKQARSSTYTCVICLLS